MMIGVLVACVLFLVVQYILVSGTSSRQINDLYSIFGVMYFICLIVAAKITSGRGEFYELNK